MRPTFLGDTTTEPLPREFTFSTWNVWFDKHRREERNTRLLSVLKEHRPHVMVFQEVTPPFVRALQAADWLKDGYWISGTHHQEIGVVLVGRVPFQRVAFHPLTSNMGRRLLLCELEGGMVVAGAHFESLRGSGSVREAQFQETVQALSGYPNAVLGGDFNCDTDAPENTALEPLTDTWSELKPNAAGYTLDTSLNQMSANHSRDSFKVRMDRILYAGGLRPVSVELLGTRKIGEGLFCSDHFGVLARFASPS